jgi:hypothetical protein
MGKYVWNKVENCRVPFNPKLDVSGDLEWRDDDQDAPAQKPEPPTAKDTTESPQPVVEKAGDDEATRATQIIDAIDQLDKDNKDHFTATGKPNTLALSQICGFPVSATERDELWASLP